MSIGNSIGVVGIGYVGKAVARGFNLFAEVKTYDIDPRRCANTLEETIESDFVFLCLPTPMDLKDGSCDLSIINKFFADIHATQSNTIFIIKSTVPVGTTWQLLNMYPCLKIVHNPEFLTARSSMIDFLTPARIVIGGEKSEVDEVKRLYQERFPGVNCICMTAGESELVKYAANCFLATKIIFFNEMRMACDKMNLDWDNVLSGILSDGRIGKSHFQVPGHDGLRGFGGNCFPKDVNALIKSMKSVGIDAKLLRAVQEQNQFIRNDRFGRE